MREMTPKDKKKGGEMKRHFPVLSSNSLSSSVSAGYSWNYKQVTA